MKTVPIGNECWKCGRRLNWYGQLGTYVCSGCGLPEWKCDVKICGKR